MRRRSRRRGRLFLRFERVTLGAGMSLAAFFIERRLLKALKGGTIEPAPRTPQDEPVERPGGLAGVVPPLPKV